MEWIAAHLPAHVNPNKWYAMDRTSDLGVG